MSSCATKMDWAIRLFPGLKRYYLTCIADYQSGVFSQNGRLVLFLSEGCTVFVWSGMWWSKFPLIHRVRGVAIQQSAEQVGVKFCEHEKVKAVFDLKLAENGS